MDHIGSLPDECFEPFERNKKMKVDLSFGSILWQPSSKREQTSIEKYDMKQFPHGLCLIINNEHFVKHFFRLDLKPRKGAEVDERNLIETFRFLGYRVEVYRNCKANEMEAVFERMQKLDHTNYDSFVCCILTHGIAGTMYMYGSDSNALDISTMTLKLNKENCKTLAGKPKLFFFQACIGKFRVASDSGIVEDSEIPNEADFFFSYATPPDELAWHDPDHGSWYISELCHCLCILAPYCDLNSMIQEVVEGKYKYATPGLGFTIDTTCVRKDVYFL